MLLTILHPKLGENKCQNDIVLSNVQIIHFIPFIEIKSLNWSSYSKAILMLHNISVLNKFYFYILYSSKIPEKKITLQKNMKQHNGFQQ